MNDSTNNEIDLKGSYLLVVDDDKMIQEVLTIKLERSGYRIKVANNGLDALKLIEEEIPALVLLDINMPGMNGYEVTKKLRSKEETCTLPILMLTAYGGLKHITKGLEIGADDYLTKPFEPEEVLVRVKSILRVRQIEKNLHEKETHLAKIDTISQLMVTMAHHINNSLASISGRAQTARADDPQKAQKLINIALMETQRISAVIQSLEDIAKQMKFSTASYAGIEDAMIDIEREILKKLEEMN